MRYGIQLCTLGPFANPSATVRLAREAEEAGWEALLVWDHLAWSSSGAPSADPWVTLGACAAQTSRLLLGTAVTPLARRRPHVVAQQLASLSLASDGRVVFGAGLGGPRAEFERFGEPGDERVRAAMLDEGLDVLARLLTGERVEHRGEHYVVADVALAPTPVRKIPFWIGGNSRPALRRAARWDGWLADGSDEERNRLSPEDVAARSRRSSCDRASTSRSSATQSGRTSGRTPRRARPGGSRTSRRCGAASKARSTSCGAARLRSDASNTLLLGPREVERALRVRAGARAGVCRRGGRAALRQVVLARRRPGGRWPWTAGAGPGGELDGARGRGREPARSLVAAARAAQPRSQAGGRSRRSARPDRRGGPAPRAVAARSAGRS